MVEAWSTSGELIATGTRRRFSSASSEFGRATDSWLVLAQMWQRNGVRFVIAPD